MRYPEGHKEEMRARIVGAAATMLRKHGLDGVSVPALMKRVGLTHGGFYGHFRDRDALVAEAVRHAASQTTEVFTRGDLSEVLATYLSEGHVDHPERGCVVAALGTEAERQHAPVRRAFADAARGLLGLVSRSVDGPCADAPSPRALRTAATMVGAVMLARLVNDPALSRQILDAARAEPG